MQQLCAYIFKLTGEKRRAFKLLTKKHCFTVKAAVAFYTKCCWTVSPQPQRDVEQFQKQCIHVAIRISVHYDNNRSRSPKVESFLNGVKPHTRTGSHVAHRAGRVNNNAGGFSAIVAPWSNICSPQTRLWSGFQYELRLCACVRAPEIVSIKYHLASYREVNFEK